MQKCTFIKKRNQNERSVGGFLGTVSNRSIPFRSKALKGLQIRVPSRKEQDALVEYWDPLEACIKALEEENKRLEKRFFEDIKQPLID